MRAIEKKRLDKIRRKYDEAICQRGSEYKVYWENITDMSKPFEYVKPER